MPYRVVNVNCNMVNTPKYGLSDQNTFDLGKGNYCMQSRQNQVKSKL